MPRKAATKSKTKVVEISEPIELEGEDAAPENVDQENELTGENPPKDPPEEEPPKPRKRGRKKKEVVPPPKEAESDLPAYAYTHDAKAIPEFSYHEVDCSNVLEDHAERVTTYEPALAAECHLDLPLVLVKKSAGGDPTPWPMKSDRLCLNCNRKIPGIPWLIPIGKSNGMYVMANEGQCCRYECALRRIIELKDFHATTQASYLADIAVRYFKMDRMKLQAANPRSSLDCYSASGLTLEAYHASMMHPEVKVNMRLPPFIPATQVFEKKHPNEARWKVQGLRVPPKEERDRIFKEERVVGPQPYPGQASMYECFLQNYDPKSKERSMLSSSRKRATGASRKTKASRSASRPCDDPGSEAEKRVRSSSPVCSKDGTLSLDSFVATKRKKTRKSNK